MNTAPRREPSVDAADSGVQSPHATHAAFRIGSLLEEKHRKWRLSRVDRKRQNVRLIGPGFVHVDAGGNQRLGHFDVAVSRRNHQWRKALRIRRMHVGMGFD